MLKLLYIATVSIVSYLIGKYYERYQWNKLIKQGKIPQPKNPRSKHDEYWVNF